MTCVSFSLTRANGRAKLQWLPPDCTDFNFNFWSPQPQQDAAACHWQLSCFVHSELTRCVTSCHCDLTLSQLRTSIWQCRLWAMFCKAAGYLPTTDTLEVGHNICHLTTANLIAFHGKTSKKRWYNHQPRPYKKIFFVFPEHFKGSQLQRWQPNRPHIY